MKKVAIIFMGMLVCVGYAVSAPVTHPTTSVTTTHPQTKVTVSHPKTTPSVLTHLPTFSTVTRPTTTATVTHPATPGSTTALVQGTTASAGASSSANTKKAAAENAGAKPSMMSTYQPMQAKDLKAAKGSASDGLGNKDSKRAEKDAVASEQKPQAIEASLESIKAMQNTSGSNLKSKLADAFGK